MQKKLKDMKFLESEFLTFLLINYFLNDNTLDFEDLNLYYVPVNQIMLISDENNEKISIETNNFDICEELYAALKGGKKVHQINLKLKSKEIEIDFSLKTFPLRITAVKAPKSLAEDFYDKVIEREKYVEMVFKTFDILLTNFIKIRINQEWTGLILNFRKYLEKTNSFRAKL
jgi:hypothetical protein